MTNENHRSQRYDIFLPIGLVAMDTFSGKVLARPFSTRIINSQIVGQPFWMDSFHQGDIIASMVGVEFSADAENAEMLHLEQVVSMR